ncbi:hypothetical protein [Haloferax gibbonsii]|nr:hypothetical protein [Haloferax gibbonsii]
MSGKIHRYEILEESALLPGVGPFPEPDFWSNEHPIMAICEPAIRAGQDTGDWIFHVPKVGETTSGPKHQIAGMLKIKEKLDARQIINDDRFSEEWTKRFKIDLADCGHLIDDLLDNGNENISTVQGRVTNHLVGHPNESKWFGASDVDIRTVANDIGISLGSFGGQQVAEIPDGEADRLADELSNRLEEEVGTPPNAVF